MEFSGYREYQPTDDAHRIDWKASLRAHKLLVKELDEDKTLQVLLLVDTGDTMLYGSGKRLKAEEAMHVASTLAYPALRSGDSCGLLMYSNQVRNYAQPKIGMQQHAIITKMLTEEEAYTGAFSLQEALRTAAGITKQRGLLIIISDFIGLQPGWDHELRAANQHFDIIGVMIRDPRDRELPTNAGTFSLTHPTTGQQITIDTKSYAKPYREYVLKEEADIKRRFSTAQASLLLLELGSDVRETIMRFFAQRAAMMET